MRLLYVARPFTTCATLKSSLCTFRRLKYRSHLEADQPQIEAPGRLGVHLHVLFVQMQTETELPEPLEGPHAGQAVQMRDLREEVQVQKQPGRAHVDARLREGAELRILRLPHEVLEPHDRAQTDTRGRHLQMLVSALQILDVEKEPADHAHEDAQRRQAALVQHLRPRLHGEVALGPPRADPPGGETVQVHQLRLRQFQAGQAQRALHAAPRRKCFGEGSLQGAPDEEQQREPRQQLH